MAKLIEVSGLGRVSPRHISSVNWQDVSPEGIRVHLVIDGNLHMERFYDEKVAGKFYDTIVTAMEKCK